MTSNVINTDIGLNVHISCERSDLNTRVQAKNGRSTARIAAVQALYQMEIAGTGVEAVVVQFREGLTISLDDHVAASNPDWHLFAKIVRGVVAEQAHLDKVLHATLPDDWPLNRIDSVVRATLRGGAYECFRHRDMEVAMVLREYVDISDAFFDQGREVALVHGVLNHVARELRAPAAPLSSSPSPRTTPTDATASSTAC